MIGYFLARLGEASTWRSLVLMLTYFGLKLDPAQQEAIVGVGLAVYAVVGAFLPDKLGKTKTADGVPVDIAPGADPFGYPEPPSRPDPKELF